MGDLFLSVSYSELEHPIQCDSTYTDPAKATMIKIIDFFVLENVYGSVHRLIVARQHHERLDDGGSSREVVLGGRTKTVVSELVDLARGDARPGSLACLFMDIVSIKGRTNGPSLSSEMINSRSRTLFADWCAVSRRWLHCVRYSVSPR